MKKITTLSFLFLSAFSVLKAQAVNDSVITGANYVNQIWYSLANDEQGTQPKDNWDLAFEVSGFSGSVLANTQKGLTIYQTPYAIASWATIDTTGAVANWPVLHNSEQTWDGGALNSNPDGNLDLGWGQYDVNTHIVSGDSIYLVKLVSGSWKKLRIDALASGSYQFTWANVDGSDSTTATVAKSSYTGKNFAYYSLETKTAFDREPATTAWDLTFTKFYGLTPSQGGPVLYSLTGVLQNKKVKSFKAYPVDAATTAFDTTTFTPRINTLGADWKTFNNSTFAYEIADSTVYFVKTAAGDIWKVIFTGFSGGSAGKYVFSKELVQAAAIPNGIAETQLSALGMYPNPAKGQFSLVYNYDGSELNSTAVNVFDLTGRMVAEQTIAVQQGINQHSVDISSLQPGIYMVALPGFGNKAQRLIIQ
jgi:hypothetical protein